MVTVQYPRQKNNVAASDQVEKTGLPSITCLMAECKSMLRFFTVDMKLRIFERYQSEAAVSRGAPVCAPAQAINQGFLK